MEFTREPIREDLFYSAHYLKPVVYVGYELNTDNTFKTIVIKVNYKDKEWVLIEVYKGNTNLSDYVTLTGVEEPFRNPRGAFNDAELRLVELMKAEV